MGTERPPVLKWVGADGVSKMFRLREGVNIIGRSTDCTIVIDDPSLSRRHFEITCDSGRYRLRDLQSRNGVLVNGQVMRMTAIRPGDRITAGAVDLDVEPAPDRLSETSPEDGAEHPVSEGSRDPGPATLALARPIFSSTEPSLPAVAPPPAPDTLRAALTTSLERDPAMKLYAVVDGAAAFDVAFMARLMGHELFTLFSGPLADAAAHVGPCLVVVREPSAFLKTWVDRIGGHAGILLETPVEAAALCAHLRHVFVANDEGGQEYFFRFYDPRVLRVFLPTCHPEELREFFGPVIRWIGENVEANAFEIFSLRGTELHCTTVRTAG